MDEREVSGGIGRAGHLSAPAKTLLINTVLAVFALGTAFVFCEFVVRLLYRDETTLFPRYHTDYRYGRYVIRGIRPNSDYWMTSVDGSWNFVTNNKGFRNTRDFSYAKPTNTVRVLSIGDSHTQGYEVRQLSTFSAVLERVLNLSSLSAEVINAGVSGFSTAEAMVFLENEGIKYSPDVVVLGFFANDFEDNLKAGLFEIDKQDQLTEQKYEHLPGIRVQNAIYSIPFMRWLSENSYFYSLLFNRVWDFFKARLAESKARQGASPIATDGGREYAVPSSATFSPYQVALAAALIERMHKFCTDREIRFILVDIPFSRGHYRYASSLSPELLKRLEAARVEYVSSVPLLQAFSGVAELHAPHGHHHISELTHALIGAEIGRRLVASGIGAAKK